MKQNKASSQPTDTHTHTQTHTRARGVMFRVPDDQLGATALGSLGTSSNKSKVDTSRWCSAANDITFISLWGHEQEVNGVLRPMRSQTWELAVAVFGREPSLHSKRRGDQSGLKTKQEAICHTASIHAGSAAAAAAVPFINSVSPRNRFHC